MSQILFLNVDDILSIHNDLIEEFGGLAGLRDQKLLESAVASPQQSFGGNDLYPTIFTKAAALTFHLVSNHPFVDGNKRTGAASGATFLSMNGFDLDSTLDEDGFTGETILETTILGITSKTVSIQELAKFFEEHSVEQ